MNYKNVLLILLICISTISQIKAEKCFCAFACGPRNVGETEFDDPKPYILKKGKFKGRQICLCAPRDKQELIKYPKKCDSKLSEEVITITNEACGGN